MIWSRMATKPTSMLKDIPGHLRKSSWNLPSAWLGMVEKAPIKMDKIWKNGVTILIGGKYETIKMDNIRFTNRLPHSLCWNFGQHGPHWPARQAAKICQHRGPLPVPLQGKADHMEVPQLQKPMPAISSHQKMEGKPMINHNCAWVLWLRCFQIIKKKNGPVITVGNPKIAMVYHHHPHGKCLFCCMRSEKSQSHIQLERCCRRRQWEGLLFAELRKRHYNEVLIMADRRKLLETLQDSSSDNTYAYT